MISISFDPGTIAALESGRLNAILIPVAEQSFQTGDTIRVLETWRAYSASSAGSSEIEYQSDGEILHFNRILAIPDGQNLWQTPETMPESAARYLLHVSEAKQIHVKDLREADANRLGIVRLEDDSSPCNGFYAYATVPANKFLWESAEDCMKYELWNFHLEEDGRASWEKNPLAWLVSFTVERRGFHDPR